MRNLRLVAAAAVLAMGGSVLKADFVISSSRQTAAFSLGAQSYDIVTFSLTNNGANGSGDSLGGLNLALYSPSGMLIGVPSATPTKPDVYGQGSEASKAHDSFIVANVLSSLTKGLPILLSNNTLDTGSSAGVYTQTYSDQQSVLGMTGTEFATPGSGITSINPGDAANPGTAVVIAQEVVPTGALAELLAPKNTNTRVGIPAQFNDSATAFSSDSGQDGTGNATPLLKPYIDGVPEPTSLGCLGFAAVGLLSRRRRA